MKYGTSDIEVSLLCIHAGSYVTVNSAAYSGAVPVGTVLKCREVKNRGDYPVRCEGTGVFKGQTWTFRESEVHLATDAEMFAARLKGEI